MHTETSAHHEVNKGPDAVATTDHEGPEDMNED